MFIVIFFEHLFTVTEVSDRKMHYLTCWESLNWNSVTEIARNTSYKIGES